tara:strand:- start:1305 stop:2015 length:711 start_codon:yes stop_codon:yes gene_type:complete
MITLNKLTYDLLELIRGNITDDDELDLRQIEYWIHNQRALWLKNEMNRFRSIDDDLVQDLGCAELELADASSCAVFPVGCSILRTKNIIPDTIDLHHKSAITRVGPVNRTQKPFSFIPYNRAVFSGNGRLSKETVYAFLLNDRMYLKFNENNELAKLLTEVNIRGVFEDPTQVAAFNNSDGTPCYSKDIKYPISRSMINYMKAEIIKSDLRFKLMAPSDTVNDGDGKLTGTANVKA